MNNAGNGGIRQRANNASAKARASLNNAANNLKSIDKDKIKQKARATYDYAKTKEGAKNITENLKFANSAVATAKSYNKLKEAYEKDGVKGVIKEKSVQELKKQGVKVATKLATKYAARSAATTGVGTAAAGAGTAAAAASPAAIAMLAYQANKLARNIKYVKNTEDFILGLSKKAFLMVMAFICCFCGGIFLMLYLVTNQLTYWTENPGEFIAMAGKASQNGACRRVTSPKNIASNVAIGIADKFADATGLDGFLEDIGLKLQTDDISGDLQECLSYVTCLSFARRYDKDEADCG